MNSDGQVDELNRPQSHQTASFNAAVIPEREREQLLERVRRIQLAFIRASSLDSGASPVNLAEDVSGNHVLNGNHFYGNIDKEGIRRRITLGRQFVACVVRYIRLREHSETHGSRIILTARIQNIINQANQLQTSASFFPSLSLESIYRLHQQGRRINWQLVDRQFEIFLSHLDNSAESFERTCRLLRNFEIFVVYVHNRFEADRSRGRTSHKAIELMPKMKVGESLLPFMDSRCVICLDDLTVGTTVRQLPCQHVYHESCILKWLDTFNTCPTCRFTLPVEIPPRRILLRRHRRAELGAINNQSFENGIESGASNREITADNGLESSTITETGENRMVESSELSRDGTDAGLLLEGTTSIVGRAERNVELRGERRGEMTVDSDLSVVNRIGDCFVFRSGEESQRRLRTDDAITGSEFLADEEMRNENSSLAQNIIQFGCRGFSSCRFKIWITSLNNCYSSFLHRWNNWFGYLTNSCKQNMVFENFNSIIIRISGLSIITQCDVRSRMSMMTNEILNIHAQFAQSVYLWSRCNEDDDDDENDDEHGYYHDSFHNDAPHDMVDDYDVNFSAPHSSIQFQIGTSDLSLRRRSGFHRYRRPSTHNRVSNYHRYNPFIRSSIQRHNRISLTSNSYSN